MIAIASDHGGFDLKEAVRKHLEEKGITCRDFGTDNKASCDYPDFAGAAAKAVADGECERGIVICTTGIGVSIVANKVNGIRCGLCTNVTQARLTREHNDANMLALGAGITGQTAAMDIVDTFLSTEFSHGERHERRVRKIAEYEE
ncbi:MAG TPA: ribose 5-phosphate isomerase B [Lachnospiraceae bacterium]|jgi:ribose 5-phosphate isomerase B|nr:ribose 5-phosphate isomerase B [Lachnospiraceae bacterium]